MNAIACQILLSLVLLLSASGVLADAWRFSKEQQGVTIYSRYLEGSRYKQYRGEIQVPAKPDRVVRLLQDLEQIPRWHYRVERVESLRMIDMTSAYLHIINRPPWPIQRRDVVCRASLSIDQNNGRIRMVLSSVDDQLPATPRYVRLPKVEAEWLVDPVNNNASRIRYQIYSEPGGSLPWWFFNSVAMDVPLFTLINLREALSRPEFE